VWPQQSHPKQDRGIVKSSVLLACLFLGALNSGAVAADVSAKGSLSENVDAGDNYFLSKNPSGYTGKSSSAINLGIQASTLTTQYLLDSNYSYYEYFGPGARDSSPTWGTPASEKFTINHSEPLTKYNFSASWDRSDVATTALQQTGTATGRGSIDTYRASGGVTRDLTPKDSITWSANASTVSYSDPSQTPYIDYATSGAWTHRLNPTTTLTNSVNFDQLVVDNPADSQRLFWTITSALESQLSQRLVLNASLSAALVNAYQHGSVQTPFLLNTTSFQQQAGATQDWNGNVGLSYQWLKHTKVSLIAARSTTPTVFGQLQNSESIGLTLNHDINSVSSLTFLTQFSHLKAGGTGATDATASDVFTASANYSYKLTREWRTNLQYTYSQRNDLLGLVRSDAISFGLVRDFNLFGKPPQPVQKTQSELAQEELTRAQQALPNLIP
jgi:hypothetical protein